MTLNVLQGASRRLWRGYADGRRLLSRAGSTAPIRGIVGDGARTDVASWTAMLDRRHQQYRDAVAPASGDVAAVCVSRRPGYAPAVVDNVLRQSHANVELVFVTNAADFDSADLEATLAGLDAHDIRFTILRRDPDESLGSCLNAAMAATSARFIAKFDDDDRYGAHYVADALRAHAYAGAGVVGKHTYYAYLEVEDRTVLRFPAHEFRYSSTLAGGTLVIDRERTGDLTFPDLSLGEDRGFIASCHRAGISTFAADRFNFVQTRGLDNTWSIPTDEFVERAVDVGPGHAWPEIDR